MLLRRKHDGWYLVLLGACLAYSALGCEWTWGLVNPYVLNATSRVLVLPLVIVLGLSAGAFSFARRDRALARVAAILMCVFVLVIILGQLVANESSPTRFDYYVTLALTPTFGILGYSYANRGRDVRYAYRGAAAVLACVGAYAAFASTNDPGDSFPSLSVGFPVALFVVFGYAWYLVAWIRRRGLA